LIGLWKLESELLCVVVDILNALQLQANEALITASEGFLGRSRSCLASQGLGFVFGFMSSILHFRGVVALVVEVVSCSSCSGYRSGDVDGVIVTTAGWLSGIATELLLMLADSLGIDGGLMED
jgi:hypothetical protein